MSGPFDGWVDFCLIPDATCSATLNEYRRKRGLPCFDVIAIDRDMARMWNLPVRQMPGATEQRHPLEETHPFWVDDRSFVHILPDDLITIKRTKEVSLDCSQNIELRTPEPSTIRLILAEQAGDVLRIKPNARILMVDQYEAFLDQGARQKYQLEYACTSAPPYGLFTAEQERKFYELLRQAQLSRNIETRDVETRTDDYDLNVDETSRHAYILWRAFVPNYEQFDRDEDVRWLDVYLNDANDSLFWRDLVGNILENEYLAKQAKDDDAPSKRRICLVIRARVHMSTNDYSEDQANSTNPARKRDLTSDRALGQASLNASQPANLRARLTANADLDQRSRQTDARYDRLAILRRVKRFGAFFARVYEIMERNDLLFAPRIFWTCPTAEREAIYTAYSDMLREYIIGLRENIHPFDRFVHVERILNAIGSHCAITPEPFAHDANVLGIFHETLIGIDALFPQTVYGLGASGTYIAKSTCGAPIYKLREYEV